MSPIQKTSRKRDASATRLSEILTSNANFEFAHATGHNYGNCQQFNIAVGGKQPLRHKVEVLPLMHELKRLYLKNAKVLCKRES